MKRVTTIVVLIVALVAVGPRPAVDVPDANAIAQRVPTELTHIPAYLAQEESAVTGIHANTEKRVVWAVGDGIDSTPHRTPKSVVYLHGFSATRQETAPFSETLARALGANLFETRLAGHGLPGASNPDRPLAQPSLLAGVPLPHSSDIGHRCRLRVNRLTMSILSRLNQSLVEAAIPA